MHHLMLGIAPDSLLTPPYMPAVTDALEIRAGDLLPVREDGIIRVLPNIAGFVGADTVGCMVAMQMDETDELTLLLDIGTNGEMVLGTESEGLPALRRQVLLLKEQESVWECAELSGAVDHVWLENGDVRWHTIGDAVPVGLCGSGLLDLTAVLLRLGIVDFRGRMRCKSYRLGDTGILLTQKDIREVQLAKAAICAGIELMAEQLQVDIEAIRHVYLAGAFGNYLAPSSACATGMIPTILLERIQPIGNAAGEGAGICALNQESFAYSQRLAKDTGFLELASIPQFQKRYLDALNFPKQKSLD